MTDADADRLFRDAARRMPAPVAARPSKLPIVALAWSLATLLMIGLTT
jgi:hypothetical protein